MSTCNGLKNATADSFGKNLVFARCESRYATSVFSQLGVVSLDLTAQRHSPAGELPTPRSPAGRPGPGRAGGSSPCTARGREERVRCAAHRPARRRRDGRLGGDGDDRPAHQGGNMFRLRS